MIKRQRIEYISSFLLTYTNKSLTNNKISSLYRLKPRYQRNSLRTKIKYLFKLSNLVTRITLTNLNSGARKIDFLEKLASR